MTSYRVDRIKRLCEFFYTGSYEAQDVSTDPSKAKPAGHSKAIATNAIIHADMFCVAENTGVKALQQFAQYQLDQELNEASEAYLSGKHFLILLRRIWSSAVDHSGGIWAVVKKHCKIHQDSLLQNNEFKKLKDNLELWYSLELEPIYQCDTCGCKFDRNRLTDGLSFRRTTRANGQRFVDHLLPKPCPAMGCKAKHTLFEWEKRDVRNKVE